MGTSQRTFGGGRSASRELSCVFFSFLRRRRPCVKPARPRREGCGSDGGGGGRGTGSRRTGVSGTRPERFREYLRAHDCHRVTLRTAKVHCGRALAPPTCPRPYVFGTRPLRSIWFFHRHTVRFFFPDRSRSSHSPRLVIDRPVEVYGTAACERERASVDT